MRSLIEADEPLSGYEIKIRLRERFGINPPTITVYTVIYRMVREGLIGRVYGSDGAKYLVREKGVDAFNKALDFLKQTYFRLSSDLMVRRFD